MAAVKKKNKRLIGLSHVFECLFLLLVFLFDRLGVSILC
jgi:hypothetical protein